MQDIKKMALIKKWHTMFKRLPTPGINYREKPRTAKEMQEKKYYYTTL